jgi:hypothetical protein
VGAVDGEIRLKRTAGILVNLSAQDMDSTEAMLDERGTGVMSASLLKETLARI